MKNFAIKMFEDFKADQEFYAKAMEVLKNIDDSLNLTNKLEREKLSGYDVVHVGDWYVQGDMNLDEEIGCVDRDFEFVNKTNEDGIFVEIEFCNEIKSQGTDTHAGPYKETESTITVSAILFHYEGHDRVIQVSSELETIIKSIIYKIQK
jgi:hypothetical protein